LGLRISGIDYRIGTCLDGRCGTDIITRTPSALEPNVTRSITELSEPAPSPAETFRHEAILYAGEADFVARVGSFIQGGVEADEPSLVVVSAPKIALLRDHLGVDASAVTFADMARIGQNPARIIPAWREFVSEHVTPGHPARGVGEPIWAARTADELVECERHEALLNIAFDGPPAWWLACPYDVSGLAPEVIDVSRRNHPFVAEGAGSAASTSFAGLAALGEPMSSPLPEPAQPPEVLSFGLRDLGRVRAWVGGVGQAFGLDEDRLQDLVVAVSEVATNSVRHAGGTGTLRVWSNGDTLICEVRDPGKIGDPMVGRARPGTGQTSGFGMWLVHQLCDVVQLRTYDEESVARLHMRREPLS
jgi:anti-sigma regulatory factor (Ser/Thr protein kinase)